MASCQSDSSFTLKCQTSWTITNNKTLHQITKKITLYEYSQMGQLQNAGVNLKYLKVMIFSSHFIEYQQNLSMIFQVKITP